MNSDAISNAYKKLDKTARQSRVCPANVGILYATDAGRSTSQAQIGEVPRSRSDAKPSREKHRIALRSVPNAVDDVRQTVGDAFAANCPRCDGIIVLITAATKTPLSAETHV